MIGLICALVSIILMVSGLVAGLLEWWSTMGVLIALGLVSLRASFKFAIEGV